MDPFALAAQKFSDMLPSPMWLCIVLMTIISLRLFYVLWVMFRPRPSFESLYSPLPPTFTSGGHPPGHIEVVRDYANCHLWPRDGGESIIEMTESDPGMHLRQSRAFDYCPHIYTSFLGAYPIFLNGAVFNLHHNNNIASMASSALNLKRALDCMKKTMVDIEAIYPGAIYGVICKFEHQRATITMSHHRPNKTGVHALFIMRGPHNSIAVAEALSDFMGVNGADTFRNPANENPLVEPGDGVDMGIPGSPSMPLQVHGFLQSMLKVRLEDEVTWDRARTQQIINTASAADPSIEYIGPQEDCILLCHRRRDYGWWPLAWTCYYNFSAKFQLFIILCLLTCVLYKQL